jgi:hypothetical protein
MCDVLTSAEIPLREKGHMYSNAFARSLPETGFKAVRDEKTVVKMRPR